MAIKSASAEGADYPWVLSPECFDLLSKPMPPTPSDGTLGFNLLNVRRSIVVHVREIRAKAWQLRDQQVDNFTVSLLSVGVFILVFAILLLGSALIV